MVPIKPNVDQYEATLEVIEVIRDIRQAKEELARGEGTSHDQVAAELRAKLKR